MKSNKELREKFTDNLECDECPLRYECDMEISENEYRVLSLSSWCYKFLTKIFGDD